MVGMTRPSDCKTAVFDLDRTITRLGTWTRFCFFAMRSRPAFLLRVPLWLAKGIGGEIGLTDKQAYKRYSLRLLSLADQKVLERKAQHFVERELARGLRKSARTVIETHRAAGARLILVTACSDVLAGPFGKALGFDHTLSTPLAWAGEGQARRLTMAGRNCYGPEKLRRLEELRDETRFQSPICAYSDHVSDLEMLRYADIGIAVNPSAKLKEAAQRSALPIVDFDVDNPLKTLETKG